MTTVEEMKKQILYQYGLTEEDLLSSGMEAEVYANSTETVVKLYAGTNQLTSLKTLQAFYDGLDRAGLPYELPQIVSVQQQGDFCVSVEKFLPGKIMTTFLSDLPAEAMDRTLERYLDALLSLAQVEYPQSPDRFLLFDRDGVSRFQDGDWHGFLSRFLDQRIHNSRAYLEKDVADFEQKLQRMKAVLAVPYSGELKLVHGDYYPGNLLVDPDLNVTGVIDFGMLTMLGDPLFDVATAWVFFDMYDELRANLRERCLRVILSRLGEGVRRRLYRYVLLYSFISADTYSPSCEDGQYQWCVDNLNCVEYWKDFD